MGAEALGYAQLRQEDVTMSAVNWQYRVPLVSFAFRLWLIRVVWGSALLGMLIVLIVGIPGRYNAVTQPVAEQATEWREAGVLNSFYAHYIFILDIIYTIGWMTPVFILAWRRWNDPLIIFVSFTLMTYGLSESEFLTATQIIEVNGEFIGRHGPILGAISEIEQMLGGAAILSLFFIFPNGKFVPHSSWRLVALWGVLNVIWTLFPRVPLNTNYYDTWIKTPELSFGLYFLVFTLGLGAQIYRYRRVATPSERQQAKWVLVGLMFAYLAQWVQYFPLMPAEGRTVEVAYIMPLVVSFKAMLPITVTLAIMRYRLWDIDIFINRALVYSVLTALIAGIYVGAAVLFSRILRTNVLDNENNLLASFGAMVVVLILFQPIREAVQYTINRLMYGERDDPYAVMNRLTDQYGQIEHISDILPMAVQTIAQALKVPYAAVEFKSSTESTTIEYRAKPASHSRQEVLERFELIFQNDLVGELVAARRHPQESFTPRDFKFLARLKPLIAVVTHDVQMVNRWRRALEEVVTAREEERRNLQRTIHGDIAASLYAQSLQVEMAIDFIQTDPAKCEAILNEIRHHLSILHEQLRKLSHALRPYLLDTEGLAPALRDLLRNSNSSHMNIAVSLPDEFPPVAAVIETALYRIIQNALDNIIRHAKATSATVQVWIEGQRIYFLIQDNGIGFDKNATTGQGLLDMHKMAREVGGDIDIDSTLGQGTKIMGWLPLLPPIEDESE